MKLGCDIFLLTYDSSTISLSTLLFLTPVLPVHG